MHDKVKNDCGEITGVDIDPKVRTIERPGKF